MIVLSKKLLVLGGNCTLRLGSPYHQTLNHQASQIDMRTIWTIWEQLNTVTKAYYFITYINNNSNLYLHIKYFFFTNNSLSLNLNLFRLGFPSQLRGMVSWSQVLFPSLNSAAVWSVPSRIHLVVKRPSTPTGPVK